MHTGCTAVHLACIVGCQAGGAHCYCCRRGRAGAAGTCASAPAAPTQHWVRARCAGRQAGGARCSCCRRGRAGAGCICAGARKGRRVGPQAAGPGAQAGAGSCGVCGVHLLSTFEGSGACARPGFHAAHCPQSHMSWFAGHSTATHPRAGGRLAHCRQHQQVQLLARSCPSTSTRGTSTEACCTHAHRPTARPARARLRRSATSCARSTSNCWPTRRTCALRWRRRGVSSESAMRPSRTCRSRCAPARLGGAVTV